MGLIMFLLFVMYMAFNTHCAHLNSEEAKQLQEPFTRISHFLGSKLSLSLCLNTLTYVANITFLLQDLDFLATVNSTLLQILNSRPYIIFLP